MPSIETSAGSIYRKLCNRKPSLPGSVHSHPSYSNPDGRIVKKAVWQLVMKPIVTVLHRRYQVTEGLTLHTIDLQVSEITTLSTSMWVVLVNVQGDRG